jgi:plastocyanin
MNRRRVTLSALAVLIAAGGAFGCGGDGDDDGSLASAGDDSASGEVPEDVVVREGAEVAVESLDNTFRPENIQVAPGTTVTWTNDGRNEHNVLPVEGGDGWGVEVEDFQPGDAYQHTFETPGTYDYYCSIHGTTTAGMIGAVVVE